MDRVFALDIGTRLVMGLIMEKDQDSYHIVASARTEHRQRAMYDGQVHDIDEVAQAVERVKNELEQKIGEKLHYVSVAAAGRALKTAVATARRSEDVPVIWSKESILALEMEAVQQALRQIQSEEDALRYHCVGYSTVESWLEGQRLTNLTGQRGKEVQVKVIATFLPRTVIDGLTGVISKVGLEMQDLTLEPIAAGQAAIPPDMRRMNLALVDVGAGTADIALTRNGSFFAYGMVPMAGDEITEQICQQYLIDFQTGEQLKRSLVHSEILTIANFLGIETTVSKEEIYDLIKPTVLDLADKIVQEILRLNQGVPHAVILIGGGSLTPLLPECISDLMDIQKARVGIQIRERLNAITGDDSVNGPEAITPIGIGISAIQGDGLHYFTVSVNHIQVPIFELQLATVSDALIAAGISPRLLLGRPGLALTFEVNGEMKIYKGGFGKPAQITLNGVAVQLDHELQPGDEIQFSPAQDGERAKITFADLFPEQAVKKIKVNGEWYRFEARISSNGVKADRAAEVADGCKITYQGNDSLKDLLCSLNIPATEEISLNIKINGREQIYPIEREIFVNEQKAALDFPLEDDDEVVIRERELYIKDLDLQSKPLLFYVNGQEVTYPAQSLRVTCQGQSLSGTDRVIQGMELAVEGAIEKKLILSDLLPYINISQDVVPGSRLELRKNNQEAEFTTPLLPGDRIGIKWGKIV